MRTFKMLAGMTILLAVMFVLSKPEAAGERRGEFLPEDVIRATVAGQTVCPCSTKCQNACQTPEASCGDCNSNQGIGDLCPGGGGGSGSAFRCVGGVNKAHPTNAYFVSWRPRILSFKNS